MSYKIYSITIKIRFCTWSYVFRTKNSGNKGKVGLSLPFFIYKNMGDVSDRRPYL